MRVSEGSCNCRPHTRNRSQKRGGQSGDLHMQLQSAFKSPLRTPCLRRRRGGNAAKRAATTLRAVRDETRGPVQTETAESLPRDRRGRFHRPHPTGTVPADVHAKFCTSVEKAVQTSIVTREAQKGCCLRGSRPSSGISQEIKSLDTSCETRTRNLQIRSLARCPLRQ